MNVQAVHGDQEQEISERICAASGWDGDHQRCLAVVVAGGVVSIVSQVALNSSESQLVANGGDAAVAQLRTEVRQSMRDELIAAVEAAVDSRIMGFLTACQGGGGFIVDTFICEPLLPADDRPTSVSGSAVR